jgi:stress-induced-phosphoprotein 1
LILNQIRADFKLIAKAYGRIGNAYAKLGNLDLAIKNLNKSLTEHRTADVLNKLREVRDGFPDFALRRLPKIMLTVFSPTACLTTNLQTEKEKKEADAKAYIDPALSAAAREEGNKLFKAGDFAGSVKAYTEAIARDPSDARSYNNRAAAYQKLVALPEALKDSEKAVEVDPKFGQFLRSSEG